MAYQNATENFLSWSNFRGIDSDYFFASNSCIRLLAWTDFCCFNYPFILTSFLSICMGVVVSTESYSTFDEYTCAPHYYNSWNYKFYCSLVYYLENARISKNYCIWTQKTSNRLDNSWDMRKS